MTSARHPNPTPVIASPALQKAIKAMVKSLGTAETASTLGVSRDAVARLAAGLGVRRGTLALAERGILAVANMALEAFAAPTKETK